MTSEATATALFPAMVVMAGAAWGFMTPLRTDADTIREETRSIIPGQADRQRRAARRVKDRYRNWTLLATFACLATGIPAFQVLTDIDPGLPWSWQKTTLVFVWLGYLVATSRLWVTYRSIDIRL